MSPTNLERGASLSATAPANAKPDGGTHAPLQSSHGKPVLIDGFCKAGGCTKGYQRAGFYVIGVDIERQPNYCGDQFVQADFLDYLRDNVLSYAIRPAVIHASPPCQNDSSLKGLKKKDYPRLIAPVRELLLQTGLPYIIENVVGADLRNPVRLCGSSFGLRVRRHRLFEMTHPPMMVPLCSHALHPAPLDVTGSGGPTLPGRTRTGGGVSRKPKDLADARDAMGIDWMNRAELSEAIPPAYTEFLGRHLIVHLQQERIAA